VKNRQYQFELNGEAEGGQDLVQQKQTVHRLRIVHGTINLI
jgi:hypothetical protein